MALTAQRETTVRLPHDWEPKAHQLPLWRHLAGGGKRAVAIWHRRAGKDSVALNYAAWAAIQRSGLYWHLLPELSHARRVIWNGIDRKGRRMIDQAFPPEIRESTHDNEMRIKLKNGSIWQCVGSDNYDSLTGANPIFVAFSEYALADPQAWEILRPILAENQGQALFISTPRGENHLADLYRMAEASPAWFAELLTVDHTGAIEPQAIADERSAGMPDSMIRQEFYCSFSSGQPGAYYAAYLSDLEDAGQLCRVPWESSLPVHSSWDLGVSDATSIWLAQTVGPEVRIIGYLENSGVGLEWYVKELDKLPCRYGEHFLPPDVAVRELGTGQSRKSVLASLGIKATVIPQHSVSDGINAARGLLPKCWFDTVRCERGLKALRNYRCEYSEKLQTFSGQPVHDWSSHAADAFRYLAVGLGRLERKERRQRYGPRPTMCNSDPNLVRW